MIYKNLLDKTLDFFRERGYTVLGLAPDANIFESIISTSNLQKCIEKYYDYDDVSEQKRVLNCSWIESHIKGNWGASQKQIEETSRDLFDYAISVSKKKAIDGTRFYIAFKENSSILYWVGRDTECMQDIYWYFERS